MTVSDLSYEDSPLPAEADPATLFRRADVCLTNEPRTNESRWLSRAPGRLDVMGGIAEYSGAVILASTVKEGVSVAVQLRNDDKVVIYGERSSGTNDPGPITLEPSVFNTESFAGFGNGMVLGSDPSAPWALAVAGALYAMHRTGKLDGLQHGVSIVVDGDLPPLVDVGYTSAVAVAALMALSGAWGLRLDPFECAQLAKKAENEVVGCPCGAAAALGVLHGRPGALTQVDCQENQVLADLEIPPEVALLGIDCGTKRADAREKYVRARVAASMGCRIIERILAARDGHAGEWNGWLGHLSIDDYVGCLRDRIPTKIKGADFLERFGQIADPLTKVDSELVYRVRSRTEHHIYEASRSRKFAERLAYAGRTQKHSAFTEAGELMYASHWSYGQRCGLGSVETDVLVKTLREYGKPGGLIHGAKISGQGAGGVVVVLIDNTPEARAVVRDAVSHYQRETSLTTRIFDGSSRGALHYGVRQG